MFSILSSWLKKYKKVWLTTGVNMCLYLILLMKLATCCYICNITIAKSYQLSIFLERIVKKSKRNYSIFFPNWCRSLHTLPDYSKPFRSASLLCKSNQTPRTRLSTFQTRCHLGTFCCSCQRKELSLCSSDVRRYLFRW